MFVRFKNRNPQGERKMGYYVNPQGESKASFLKREGIPIANSPKITWKSVPKGYLPVALVSNGAFNAAGIAFCESELDAFTRLDDPRPRQIFMVPVKKLVEASNEEFREYA